MFIQGCQRLADYLEGVKKNYESTAQVLKHNCETNGHGESCYKLGAYYVTGKGNELLLYMLYLLRKGFVCRSSKKFWFHLNNHISFSGNYSVFSYNTDQ